MSTYDFFVLYYTTKKSAPARIERATFRLTAGRNYHCAMEQNICNCMPTRLFFGNNQTYVSRPGFAPGTNGDF